MEQSLPPNPAATENALGADEATVAVYDTPPAAARRAAPIVALSEDPTLLDAMAAAALDQATVIVSPSPDRFIDQLVATASELALIDAGSAPPDLAEFVRLLHHQFPQLQLLVAAPGNVQHQISPQIADGTVFRFVHKPASAQRLRLFVDAALRARQSRITEEILNTTLMAEGRPLPTPPARAPMRGLLLTGVLLGVLLAGALLALEMGGLAPWRHSVPTTPHVVPSDTPPAAPASNLAGRVSGEPADTRAATPSPAALAAQAAAEQEAIDRAAAERSGQSERERLAAENDLHQAVLAEQARRSALDARYQQLLADAASAERVDVAQLQLDPMIVPREAATAAEKAQVRLPEEEPEPPAVRAQISPPPSGTPPLGTEVVEESTLHRLSFVAPSYPTDAQIRKVGGTVELNFTVTPRGAVTDIAVIAAEPKGVFEHAATSALSRSRYQPVMRDGMAVAQRVHLRLRFTP